MFPRTTHSCLSWVRGVVLQEEAFVHTKLLPCVYMNLPQNEWAGVLLLALNCACSLHVSAYPTHLFTHVCLHVGYVLILAH